jgi:hypothetical protein
LPLLAHDCGISSSEVPIARKAASCRSCSSFFSELFDSSGRIHAIADYTDSRREGMQLAGDQLALPGQDGVRPGHIGDLAQNLAAQSMTDLAQRGSLSVREPQPPIQLGLQNAILGRQIFITCRQFLVQGYPFPT